MHKRLTIYCAHAFPDKEALAISEPINISNGWETEIYAFALEHGPAGHRQSEKLILRLYPGEGAQATATHEFRAMTRLYENGYPVPRVLAQESEISLLGKPFILMEQIDGQLMWSLLPAAAEEEQERLIAHFCELFVLLHRLDWTLFAGEADREIGAGPYQFVDQMLHQAEEYLQRFEKSSFLPGLAWLVERRNTVPCPRPSATHGDYHPNNILVQADGQAFVIDWSGFDITDCRFDLAWSLLLFYAYRGTEMRNRVLLEYERLSGVKVEQLAFFEAFACLKRLFYISVSLSAGPEALGMDPAAKALIQEQIASHRRVYDLFLDRTGIRIGEVEALFE